MAGAGYRNFSPNTVLTADQVQNFLMDQSVQVYADASERDTTLTGVVTEGMVAYLEDENRVYVFTGSVWEEVTPSTISANIIDSGTLDAARLPSISADLIESGTLDAARLPSISANLIDSGTLDPERLPSATPTTAGIVPGLPELRDGSTNPETREFSNFAIGWNALENAQDSGDLSDISFKNTAIGLDSMRQLTSGNRNVALGNETLKSSTDGQLNTAIGQESFKNLTTGSSNVGLGSGAGANITDGSDNTAVGAGSLSSTGSVNLDGNTSVGKDSMVFVTSGLGNTAVGKDSLILAEDANNNTAVGTESGPQTFSLRLTGNNNTMLGYQATTASASSSNSVTLGNSSITSLRCATGSITTFSDRRDKKNIEDLNLGLNLINELKPVKFDWNMRDQGKVDVPDSGFIAQDVIEAEDKLDAHKYLQLSMRDNEERYEISPSKLIPVLVNAVKELSAEVESLKAQIAEK